MHPYSRKLLRSPAAFEALVGVSVAAFADLVEEVGPAFDAAELERKARLMAWSRSAGVRRRWTWATASS